MLHQISAQNMLMCQSLVYFGTSGELEAPAPGTCSKNPFSLFLVMKRILCKNYSFTNLFALYFLSCNAVSGSEECICPYNNMLQISSLFKFARPETEVYVRELEVPASHLLIV